MEILRLHSPPSVLTPCGEFGVVFRLFSPTSSQLALCGFSTSLPGRKVEACGSDQRQPWKAVRTEDM